MSAMPNRLLDCFGPEAGKTGVTGLIEMAQLPVVAAGAFGKQQTSLAGTLKMVHRNLQARVPAN